MNQNSLPSTTAVIASSSTSEKEGGSLTKRIDTFLSYFCVGLVFLSLVACGNPSHTKTLLRESLNPVAQASNEQPLVTLPGTQKDFTYQAQDNVKPVSPLDKPEGLETVTTDPTRTVILSGVIDSRSMFKANELMGLAASGKAPIDVIISSPGGSIDYGLSFIRAMKDVQDRGITIRCYVPTMAASMAYTIFTQCSERYALPYALLLFHSPRIGGNLLITAQGSRQLAVELTRLEVKLLSLIAPIMGINEASAPWFQQSYDEERLFNAADLLKESPVRWFSVVGKIQGLATPFPEPRGPKTAAEGVCK